MNVRFVTANWIARFLAAVACLLLVQGCATKLKDREALNRLTQRHGLGTFYYIGSERGFHFFASKYFLEPTKYYRLRASEYSFQNPFPKTSDTTKWIPYTFDLNAKEKGFYGEPQDAIQPTNSSDVSPKR